MKPAGPPAPLNILAEPKTRGHEAEGLARRWGVEAVCVLIRDRELGILRPAPGFSQTLPGGPSWRALLRGKSLERHTGEVAYPHRDRMVEFAAQGVPSGEAMLLLLGEGATDVVLDLDALGFPLLAALLQAEGEAVNAAGIVQTAAKALDRAETLTGSLDLARGKLTEALATSDALNRALNELNTTLKERVEDQTRQLEAETAERQNAEEAMRHAQKIARAVGRAFAAACGHDFNNLLACISGSLELMELRISRGRIAVA